jgi:hypothetical protein
MVDYQEVKENYRKHKEVSRKKEKRYCQAFELADILLGVRAVGSSVK